MAHDHEYLLTMLKTPKGYLTKTGFTNDINSNDIVVLRSNTFGKWSTMLSRLEYFLEETSLSEEDSKKLCDSVSKCETIAFRCQHGVYCDSCIYKTKDCKFWNGHRKELDFFKLYSI